MPNPETTVKAIELAALHGRMVFAFLLRAPFRRKRGLGLGGEGVTGLSLYNIVPFQSGWVGR